MSTAGLTFPAVATIVSAVVSAGTAIAALLLSRVPAWRDFRALGWVAISAALIALSDFPATLPAPDEIQIWSSRLVFYWTSVHLLAWHLYVSAWARRPLTPRERVALRVLLAAGLAALVPGAVFGDTLVPRAVPWLGVVYRDPGTTAAALPLVGIQVLFLAWLVARVVRLRSAGPWPRVHLASTLWIAAVGLHDFLTVEHIGFGDTDPYLTDLVFVGPMTVFGIMALQRIIRSDAELRTLNAGLETAVLARTQALERSQAALARAERQAALGQFSAGIAHQINNPAAVLAANLACVARDLADDPREDLRECLADCRAAVDRIAALVRQLVAAGRAGRSPSTPLFPVTVAEAVAEAVGRARALAPAGVALSAEVAPGLRALAHEEPVVQALSHLLVNGLEAVPGGRAGRVVVTAAVTGDRVAIVVQDDGEGMSKDALARAFEPFFSTRPANLGLGLPVSRALVESMQGTLRLESAPGRGTRATIELRRAESEARTPPVAPPRIPV
jgi:signal transduction histidine kinase